MRDEDTKKPVVHRNLAVIETKHRSLMDDLFANPRIRPYLWIRVSPNRALIAPDEVSALQRALEADDLLPHFARELWKHGEVR